MNETLPIIYLARHGETAWSLSGQHTGLTDLPLTKHGEQNARGLATRLEGLKFVKVFSSPLQRAIRTCELAGFKSVAAIDPDLVEWDYGEYEGLTTPEIRETTPSWWLWRDGCPGGEMPPEIGTRVDRVLERFASVAGSGLVFAHGHVLRVFTARWLEMEVAAGARFKLEAGSLGVLGHERETQVIERWSA